MSWPRGNAQRLLVLLCCHHFIKRGPEGSWRSPGEVGRKEEDVLSRENCTWWGREIWLPHKGEV